MTFNWDTNHVPPNSLSVYTVSISLFVAYPLDIASSKTKTHLYKGIAWVNGSADQFTGITVSSELSLSFNLFIEKFGIE